ncbi:hypothetical protein MMC25_004081 [Agyrium rufum]|nr:hypothetical protein [Agyrium rufum]
MDDLSGLSWSSSSNPTKSTQPTQGNYYPSFRPTPPVSGRSTPLSVQNSGAANNLKATSPASMKPASSAGDSFANLVSFSGSHANKNLSLQEIQKQLQEQKIRQFGGGSVVGTKNTSSSLAVGDASQWDQLEARSAGPNSRTISPLVSGVNGNASSKLSNTIDKPFAAIRQQGILQNSTKPPETEDDLLAAFAADAPVDSSTNFPISAELNSRSVTPQNLGLERDGFVSRINGAQNVTTAPEADDDDPFGLGMLAKTDPAPRHISKTSATDDDDFLGDLGKPVSELPPRRSSPPEISNPTSRASGSNPQDKAIAELVDMGFGADIARNALEATESGVDIQAAVGLILTQAHANAKQQSRSQTPLAQDSERHSRPQLPRDNSADSNSVPAWMRQQGRSSPAPRREDSRSPAVGEKDPAKIAADLGNNLLKTANTFWKTGTKKLNQAVAEFNSDSDSGQPKWMRDVPANRTKEDHEIPARPRRQVAPEQASRNESAQQKSNGGPDLTDEALLLESGGGRPPPRVKRPASSRPNIRGEAPTVSRDQSPVFQDDRHSRRTTTPQQLVAPPVQNARSKLSRQALEEEEDQAYISPARRKKQSTPQPRHIEPNLLETSSRPPQSTTSRSVSKPSTPIPAPVPSKITPRPPAPKRNIPTISPIALKSSTQHRQAGTESFKLGNYAQATDSYSASLATLPNQHPIMVLLLTNRALTHLKNGNPKACIADANSAMAIVGPSKGNDETIDLGGSEGNKSMSELWGKAMTRKAEATEQLEQWNEAAKLWKDCVEANVGGHTSIQGRNRCEKAAGIGSAPPPVRRPAAPSAMSASVKRPVTRPSSATTNNKNSTEAVTRLRAANAAAEKADDEKFALADQVDSRLANWRKGKEGNLRALLGSLDAVLWEGSGWKKIGMSELIIPGKVKVHYMKGIAKVHPDKLPTTATTEQVMISGAVFSTLNEAWDRFKQENGL